MRMMPLNFVGTEAPLPVPSPDLYPRNFFIKMLNFILYNMLSLKLLNVSKDLFHPMCKSSNLIEPEEQVMMIWDMQSSKWQLAVSSSEW